MEFPNLLRAIAVAVMVGSVLLVGLAPEPAQAQNCGCASTLCCSQYGYCGSTAAYCGAGCKSGPCYSDGVGGNSGVKVADVVSDAFFDGILAKADGGCAGKSFYTRSAFLKALGSYRGFAQAGSADDSKREIAAFFAHVTHETGHFCYMEEINGRSKDYCDRSNTEYRCVPGKGYHGRGAIQLTGNYNYGAAGKSIGFDGIGSPEMVAQDSVIAFKTAIWFWMNNVRPVIGQGFGATTRAINGRVECDGGKPGAVNARVGYYRDYCRQLGVQPGANLYC